MSRKNESRKYIRQAAQQHKEAVNQDAIWNGIQQKMNVPAKKRRIIPFYFWGVGIIAIALISFLVLSNPHEKNELNTAIELDNSDKNNATKEVNHIDHDSYITSEQELPNSKIDLNNETNTSLQNSNIPSGQNQLQSNSKNDHRDEGDLISIEENGDISNVVKEQKESLSFVQSEFSGATSSPLHNNTFKNPSLNNNHIKENDPKISISTFNTKNKILSRNHILLQEIPTLFLTPNFNQEYIQYEANPSKIIRNQKNKNITSFFSSVLIYSQYASGSKKIEGSTDYIILRNKSEKLLEQLRFGLETDIYNYRNFTFYGGLSYSFFNNKAISTELYYQDQEITYLKSYYIQADGTRVENYVTEELPHLNTEKITRYNSYRIFSAPIGMRFGKQFSNISIGINAGFDISYMFSDTHTLLNADEKFSDVSIEAKWLKPSFHTGLSLDYRFSGSYSLHSKIMYRKVNFENTISDVQVKENYSLFGADLGIRFHF